MITNETAALKAIEILNKGLDRNRLVLNFIIYRQFSL